MTEIVPEFIGPVDPPEITPVRPIGWLAAIPLLVILPFAPRRVGVRASVTGWTLTVFVHGALLLAAVLVAGLARSLIYDPFAHATLTLLVGNGSEKVDVPVEGEVTWSEQVRDTFTRSINMLYIDSEGFGDFYGVFGFVGGLHGLQWIVAMLAMPFITAGERRGLLFKRALKLSLWSSIILVVLCVAGLYVVWMAARFHDVLDDVPMDTTLVVLGLVWLAWSFVLVRRMGTRYAGPPEGPAWTPTRPECVKCGYVLTGLPFGKACPECGTPISESVGSGDVSTLDERTAAFSRKRSWFATAWHVLRDHRFLAAIGSTHIREASRFASRTACLLGCLAGALAGVAGWAHAESDGADQLESTLIVILFFAGGFSAMYALALIAIAIVILAYGWRRRTDLRIVTSAVCYSSVAFLPTLTWWFIAYAMALWIATELGAWGELQEFFHGAPLPIVTILVLTIGSAPILLGLMPGIRTLRPMHRRLKRGLIRNSSPN